MRKFVMFLLIILVATVIAAIYGVGHDQVTYSISPEYYTKFKFIQFNLADALAAQHMTQPRSAVVMVGILATWWMGLYTGILIGVAAFVFKDADIMFQSALQALALVLLTAILAGAIGGLYGHYVLSKRGAVGWLPGHLNDKPAFVTAGAIHDLSFIGAVIGLVAGLIFLLVKNSRLRKGVGAGV